MSEEHLPLAQSGGQQQDPPKRKRIPSQYAPQIADLKNTLSTSSKRPKSIRFQDQSEALEDEEVSPTNLPLLCILPSGKKYSLTIAVEPNKSLGVQKSSKRKLNKTESTASNKGKQQKKADPNVCLLDKFLSAFQNLQKEQENDSKQNNQQIKVSKEIKSGKKEEKSKSYKDWIEKWSKLYEKHKAITQRFVRLQETFVFLV